MSFQSMILRDSEVMIIAELGINHDGSSFRAKELILHAVESGTAAVKFQYRNLSNSYVGRPNEIGDELLHSEITRNYISPQAIIELATLAKGMGIFVGISFFNETDISDFGSDIEIFDFFKVPSVELLNRPLIESLTSLDKYLLLSTGAHSEEEIELALSRLPNDNWTPLHCISNYPTLPFNAKLGYIRFLTSKWQRPVGYSSHDSNWAACIGAMALGAKVIERHITLDKSMSGLDHSSSSDPSEFHLLNSYARNSKAFFSGNSARFSNQGELLNLQNLGRSYYANSDLPADSKLDLASISYRSPKVGISRDEISRFLGKQLRKPILKDQVLTFSDFDQFEMVAQEDLVFARDNRLSLPVRIHDYRAISTEFPICNFEFHLSFREVDEIESLDFVDDKDHISIHLPDYCSPLLLVDPFASDPAQSLRSRELIEKVADLVARFQDQRQIEVPIVASFSTVHKSKSSFYESHRVLLNQLKARDIEMCLQWLPPFAWYFGGSVELSVMNALEDARLVSEYQLATCLDSSHLFMGREFFGFELEEVLSLLLPYVKHMHISDSIGVDGEGLPFGSGQKENMEIIKRFLNMPEIKVIEVWQGHLNNYKGFKEAISYLRQA